MLDLDNTLVDRRGAFTTWARDFVAGLDGDARDLEWLIAVDQDGYQPRAELAALMSERFHLNTPVPDLVDSLRHGLLERIEAYPGVLEALEILVEKGAALVVVTNGNVAQQMHKLRRTGLLRYSPHPVISEALGAKKPHRLLFDTALSQAGHRPEQSWMVGDHPVTDMTGAHQVGIRTGWVSHHQLWPHPWVPDVIGPTTKDVLQHIMAKDTPR
ncbi:HAD family hydrolase [Kocuria rosea]|uniref:HAD family hydrolase n=1 Tax=Kocuria rosea TaxID=1275 RepID=UPI0025419174|nr:HAD family hydrolase [Kocuria rosea]WIG19273.1 HAD family hydrolase [Kocuria rosea]